MLDWLIAILLVAALAITLYKLVTAASQRAAALALARKRYRR